MGSKRYRYKRDPKFNPGRRSCLRHLLAAGTIGTTTAVCGVNTLPIIGLLLFNEAGEALDALEAENTADALRIESTKVKGTTYRINGVEHVREFASTHYNLLEEEIARAGVVAAEYGPNRRSDYFATVYDLAQKHRKPFVDLTNDTAKSQVADILLGLVATLTAGGASTAAMYGKTRRAFFKRMGFAASAAYLAAGSIFNMGSRAVARYATDTFDDLGEEDKWLFGHFVDHRNTDIAERLRSLPQILDCSEGVFVTTGFAHTPGIKHYLEHPIQCKLKRLLYAPTFELLDTDIMSVHEFDKFGVWKQTVYETG